MNDLYTLFEKSLQTYSKWIQYRYHIELHELFNLENINLPSTGLPFNFNETIGFYTKLEFDPEYEGQFKLIKLIIPNNNLQPTQELFEKISQTIQTQLQQNFTSTYNDNKFEFINNNNIFEVCFEPIPKFYIQDKIFNKKLWEQAKETSKKYHF